MWDQQQRINNSRNACRKIQSTNPMLIFCLSYTWYTKQDPFRGGENVLVLCETCLPTGEPIPSNTRAKAREAFEAAPGLEPWFGIEQEYTLFDKDMVSFGSGLGCSRALTIRTVSQPRCLGPSGNVRIFYKGSALRTADRRPLRSLKEE